MAIVDKAQLERTIRIVESQVPELAPACMEVPLSYYRNEEQAARERELFMTRPRPVAAASEVAASDDFLVRTSMERSLLVTRDRDGMAHVFLNYCRHRGGEVASDCGNARRHSCPYHGWAYDSKGQLAAMPLADRNEGLDYSRYGLVELPSEERHGLVWAILTPGAGIDVAAHLGPVDAQIGALGMDAMVYRNALPYEPIGANWKCVAEGVVESLHVPFVHRATFNVDPGSDGERFGAATAVDLAIYDRFGPHLRYCLPMFGREGVADFRALVASGRPVDWRHVAQVWLISPGVLIANDAWGLDVGFMEPGSASDRSFFRYGWMGAREAPEGMPSLEDMTRRAGEAVLEDAPVWAGCGRGLKQGQHEAALIGRNELGVQLFHQALAEETGFGGLRRV